MLRGEGKQVGPSRHRAVLVGDLTQHASRSEARQSAQIDSTLGVASAAQYPAVARDQRKTCPGRESCAGCVSGSTRARIVRARSAAETPVVVASFRSTETVNAVPRGSSLAAFNTADGTVISSLHRRHRTVEFKKFLTKIDGAVPEHLDVHLVCDNYGTHVCPESEVMEM